MTDTRDLERKFWKAIDHDRTVMLGITGIAPRPMTALAEDDQAPIWFFTAAGTDLAKGLVGSLGKQATATISSKDHGLFATVSGKIVLDNDPAVIDRLWNPFIAAWFEGGKDDPKVRLLRMDPEEAAMMEAYQKAGTPGPAHAGLAATAGEYTVVIRS
jgi:general stress protein 26